MGYCRKEWDLGTLSSKDLDGLRENRTQVLVTNKVLLGTKEIEYDVLLSLDPFTDEDEPLLHGRISEYRRSFYTKVQYLQKSLLK